MKKIFAVGYSVLLLSLGAFIQSNCGSATAQGTTAASEVAFDNTSSGMSATTVQAAIDELRTLLTKTSRTDISSALLGTWAGKEFDSDTLDNPPVATVHDNFSITFNVDNTFTCSNSTALSTVCSSGTWALNGMYVTLTAGSSSKVLTISNISESHLMIVADDILETFGVWALTKE